VNLCLSVVALKKSMPNSSIDEIIRRAMDEGQFDDLPGKGKPLNLDDDPHADPAWRAAHTVLKSGGFSLPWIETRREIETDFEEALAAIKRSWLWRVEKLDGPVDPGWVEAEWGRAQASFRERVEALNKRIRAYNLEVPSPAFQRPLVRAEQEIERAKVEPLSDRKP
jgi:DnaJ homolog subfamily C member 28